ncbi:response regulator [Candidatus Solincola tengchongensis]|uniref:response regulator transcription factor n=1 Tax=Candidatus Solincola tengchongensis TaxID=2900693 RepID=UPI00257CEDFF|nr:response regulator [Candidatus Solincola tengchongensis]
MRTVAYIEDDPDMIDLVSIILRKHGYQVAGFTESKDIADRLRELKPELILLDLMMPHADGLEVYREIKSRREIAEVPVIIISAMKRAVEEIEKEGEVKVEACLVKPFTIGELLETVNRVMGERGS